MESSAPGQALASLPHGPEFRFLDRITALDPGQKGTGEYTVQSELDFLRGHFPGAPMMPGVLMVEALAQLAGATAQSHPQLKPLANLKLTAIRSAKILGAAKPGDRLEIHAEIAGRLGNLVQARGTILVCGKVLLEADLVLSGDGPQP